MEREYAVCYCKKGKVYYLTDLKFYPGYRFPLYYFNVAGTPIMFLYREAVNMINLLYALESFPTSRKLVIEKVEINA